MSRAVGLACGAALLALLLAAPLAARAAAEAAEHGPNFGLLALHVLNFAFLVYLLNRFARRPILDFLAQRSQGIRQELDSAQVRLSEAEAELESLRARVAAFEGESERIVAAGEEQARIEKDRAISRASEMAARIRQDAQRVAAQEIERARQVLRAEAAELATGLAAEIMREKLTAKDDERLVEEFIDRIGEAE